jgi:hypothetical protein
MDLLSSLNATKCGCRKRSPDHSRSPNWRIE